MTNIGGNWEQILKVARENWFHAKPLHEKRGRKPKRAKHHRWRSQQQRAFAAGVLHSVRIYDALQPHELEIRAMLYVRGMIDVATARKHSAPGPGV